MWAELAFNCSAICCSKQSRQVIADGIQQCSNTPSVLHVGQARFLLHNIQRRALLPECFLHTLQRCPPRLAIACDLTPKQPSWIPKQCERRSQEHMYYHERWNVFHTYCKSFHAWQEMIQRYCEAKRIFIEPRNFHQKLKCHRCHNMVTESNNSFRLMQDAKFNLCWETSNSNVARIQVEKMTKGLIERSKKKRVSFQL